MSGRCTTPECFGDYGSNSICRPNTDPGQGDLAAVARALAHPARVAIIEQFTDGHPRLTKDLVAPSGLAPSTVSEHLRILRESGILVTRRDGPGIWYCLCHDRLATFADSIHRLVGDGRK
jgi:ArsR family transcriptional regulator